ncbi:hypothetical protein [Bacillus cereus group sp. BfR-BA-01354]|uniref:hypothetical protein n=1 Tax=Bacillus cereus group sp. BfR-BA-01354 TaxID=2920317 RepID=UPI001F568F76
MRKKSLKHNQNKPLMNLNENTNSSIKNFLFTTSIDIFPRSYMYVQLFTNPYRNDPEVNGYFLLMDSQIYSNYSGNIKPETVERLVRAPVDHVRITLFPIDYYHKKERDFITLSNPSPSPSANPNIISYKVELPAGGTVVRLDMLAGEVLLGTKIVVNEGAVFNRIIEGSISSYYEPDTFRYRVLYF